MINRPTPMSRPATSRVSAVAIVAVASLALASCGENNPVAEPEADVEQPSSESQVTPVSDEQLTAMAFRAAWDSAPPIENAKGPADYPGPYTYRSGKLVPLGGDRFALVSSGQGGDAHASSGSLAIHYLKRTADGFEKAGSWPGLIAGGGWGEAPKWSVRSDLMPSPTLVVASTGVGQGLLCEVTQLVELTPERPVFRIERLSTEYDNSGASEDGEGENIKGRILPGRKGQTFKVEYTGVRDATVTFARVGDVYDPVDMPELPSCVD